MRSLLHAWLIITSLLLSTTVCQAASLSGIRNFLSTSPSKAASMHTMETTEFKWGLYMSHYYVDEGTTPLETHATECWMKDAQGNLVMRWYGDGTLWGGGGSPIGGDAKNATLPRTLRLTYYDYLEDKFYQLNTELPIARLYDLFRLKAIDLDRGKGQITQKYQDFVLGIAPRGYVALWLRGDNATEQIEIGIYQAQVMQGYSTEQYNREIKPAFPIYTGSDRWRFLSDHTMLKPATIAKLKQGWLPDNLYYKKQRTKYPWRFAMTGNARMLEIDERYGNQEEDYVHPWQLAGYQQVGQMRGIPQNAVFIFNDYQGKRYWLVYKLFDTLDATGQPDLSAIWAAFEQLFPGRTPQDNDYAPGDADMATVEIHASDDLKTFAATLVKGDQRIPLPTGHASQLLPLEPWSNNYGGKTPPPDVIKLQQYGPDAE